MPDSNDTKYIDSISYQDRTFKLKQLVEIIDDLSTKQDDSRKLRKADVDVEGQRDRGTIQPDEVYLPQHTIDTNIRREQSAYIQFITQSPRAVVCEDESDDTVDFSLLEKDLTKKIRFDGWQTQAYSNIDCFQAMGYGIMETVYDESMPGHVRREHVQYGDFSYITDSRSIQDLEMTCRKYYYTKEKLLKLCGDPLNPDPNSDFSRMQVTKLIAGEPKSTDGTKLEERYVSLYAIFKFMFKVRGVTFVAWGEPIKCDDWLRIPRPLFIGRVQLKQENPIIAGIKKMAGQLPASQPSFESQYPYFLYPYLISEDSTISQMLGRVFLDQHAQEGVTSLLSAIITKARRSAGMYFSKDSTDPNDDILMQKNVFFQPNALINGKIQAFKVDAPDPGLFTSIQTVLGLNQNETSQVNFAESNNQRDSRKTAKAIEASQSQQQQLSSVQVVLYSIALQSQYAYEVGIIKSRVLAGLIKVSPSVLPLYQRDFIVKPSGDTDVIERQQILQMMMQLFPMLSSTAIAPLFLSDLLELALPTLAPKYIPVLQQAMQQAQSQQAQQQQQMMQGAQQMAQSIMLMSKHRDWFSEGGQVSIYPQLQIAAAQIEQTMKAHQQNAQQPQRLQ